jgi:isoleucyl-tRNA synthetase
MDYSNTLNLPKTDFPMKADLPIREPEILKFWEENKIYNKIRKLRKGCKKYILHDGPPYANESLHIGTALNKILKDIVVKYKTMKGYDSPFVPGWDCHGMPIEIQLLKNLGLVKQGKPKDVISFRNECRNYALKYVDIQREEFKRLGVFADWENPYLTLDKEYEVHIAKVFLKFLKMGYIYRGLKPVFWCPTCTTALAEAEIEYNDQHTSPSIYVKFKIKTPLEKIISNSKDTYILIWTTTPWTLPSNVAVAVHPDAIYSFVEVDKEIYLIAENLVDQTMKEIGINNYNVIANIQGEKLNKIEYECPFGNRNGIIILENYVTLDTGTGCVHTAPGHGKEDYESGLKYNLPIIMPVDEEGKFTREVPEFKGMFVFDANNEVIKTLNKKNLLVYESKVTHSYPYCWRCHNPVIFRATKQWFMSINFDFRKKIIDIITNKVSFIPTSSRERMLSMVKDRPDWCLSRQRVWGVPLPIFICCNCEEPILDEKVLNNIKKFLEEYGIEEWIKKTPKEILQDTNIKCKQCGSNHFKKDEDILDVWLDSSISHDAVLAKNENLTWPCDVYLEGSDQHRAWFQVSLITAVALKGDAPCRTIITHGFVVDKDGKKMSKSKGNIILAKEACNKYGADIIRLWVCSGNYQEDIKISEEIIERIKESYRKIRNTFRFILGNIYDFPINFVPHNLSPIDKLIMHRLQMFIKNATNAYESFEYFKFYQCLYNFCVVDLSSLYFDIIKDILYTYSKDSMERRAAQWTLFKICDALVKVIAPVLPFTAEEVWKYFPGKNSESIHMTKFPEIEEEFINEELAKKFEKIMNIRDEILKKIEEHRKNKIIGKSLEAKVIIKCGNNLYSILNEFYNFLPTIFIVSQVELEKVDGTLSISVEKADGKKCERCWRWCTSVGASNEYPTICSRCINVILQGT